MLTKISNKVNASDKLLNNRAMENAANKAQKYLLDNNCGDLILNDHRTTKPEDRIYASDIMMMFLESERGQNVDKGESNGTIFDVRKLLIDFCEIYAEGQFEDPDDIEGIVDWYLKVKDN